MKFVKVQIYVTSIDKKSVCFDDLKRSSNPFIIINIDQIVSLHQKKTWGFCEDEHLYPYRILEMANGTLHWLVLESGNMLEKLLIERDN